MTRTEEILQEISDGNDVEIGLREIASFLASLEARVEALEEESTPSECTCPPPKPYDWKHLEGCAKAPKEPASWEERLRERLEYWADREQIITTVKAFIAEEKDKSHQEGYAEGQYSTHYRDTP